jgi:hypothetical protein
MDHYLNMGAEFVVVRVAIRKKIIQNIEDISPNQELIIEMTNKDLLLGVDHRLPGVNETTKDHTRTTNQEGALTKEKCPQRNILITG